MKESPLDQDFEMVDIYQPEEKKIKYKNFDMEIVYSMFILIVVSICIFFYKM